MRLKDKVALVTGGAAGIGKATAQRYVEEGATVVICDVNAVAGEAAAEELGVEFSLVDISDRQAVQEWIDGVVSKHGRVDVLVNNAGVLRDGQLVKWKNGEVVGQMSEENFDLVISVNLKGVFNCVKAASRPMMKQRSGKIINITSVVGVLGNPGQANYVAAKAGVIGLTKTTALELATRGITVNAVAPGFIDTEMTAGLPDDVKAGLFTRIPMGRLGQADDVARVVLFLASDAANYMTGQTLHVDGGMYM